MEQKNITSDQKLENKSNIPTPNFANNIENIVWLPG